MLFNRLAYYEDLEEKGLLIKLPCKFNTPLYSIFAATHNLVRDGEELVQKTRLTESNICAVIRQYGKTVFLTQSEAEAELKRRTIP